VIARTQGDAQRSVRPSVTPDLIPENYSETKNASTSRLRKNVLSEMKIKERTTAATARDAGKGNVPQHDAKKIEAIDELLRHKKSSAAFVHSESQKSLGSKDKAGADASEQSIIQQLSRPIHSPDQDEPNILQNMKDLPISKSTYDPEPGTDISIIRDNAIISSLDNPSATLPVNLVVDNKISEKRLASEQHPASTQDRSPYRENASSSPSSKAHNGDQAKYPPLVPAVSSHRVKDFGNMPQSEETVVTINIGQIEVRAEKPAEPPERPRYKFTPALSLTDYLRQRSEGKIG
jgi:hypothetical protein